MDEHLTESPFDRLRDSAGQAYLDRAHLRTFSLNILQMNGLELIETVRRMSDPEDITSPLIQRSRDGRDQAHRELSRHFHNFLAAAMTLVDHTRVLMKEHYSGTPVQRDYQAKVDAEIGSAPVVKFVHDLRNYMLHRGLPGTVRFTEFGPDEDGEMALTVGVRLPTAGLQNWSGWTAKARGYLERAGEDLDIKAFVEDYLTRIADLHGWLDNRLAAYHAEDVAEARRIQAAIFERPGATAPEPEVNQAPEVPFGTFAREQHSALDAAANAMLAQVRDLQFRTRAAGFPSGRLPGVTLNRTDMLGAPVFRSLDAAGQRVVAFIEYGGDLLGLDETTFDRTIELTQQAHEAAWASLSFGQPFVEDNFVDWARHNFGADTPSSFAEHLAAAARQAVVDQETWAPVAYLEVETGFMFGPVEIAPITAGVLADFRGRIEPTDENRERVETYFQDLAQEFQGAAAVVVRFRSEARLAESRALMIAQDAIALLRFFAPTAAIIDLFSPVELDGAEYLPTSKLLIVSGNSFTDRASSLRPPQTWRMSAADLAELRQRGLEQVGKLVDAADLTPYQSDLRASLLIFSHSIASADPRHRLTQALAALEGVLLRHQMEPRLAAVARRAGRMTGAGDNGRREMADLFRRAYRFLDHPATRPLRPDEIEFIRTVVYCVHGILLSTVRGLPHFTTREAFISALES
jgi:hypothetical protein